MNNTKRRPAVIPPVMQHPVSAPGLIYESNDGNAYSHCRHIYMGTRKDLLAAGIVTAAMFPDRQHQERQQWRLCTHPEIPRWCVYRLRSGYFQVVFGAAETADAQERDLAQAGADALEDGYRKLVYACCRIEAPSLLPPHPWYANHPNNIYRRLPFVMVGGDVE